jgi:hypothetical protein
MKTIFLAVALVVTFAAAPAMAEQFAYFQAYHP